MPVLLLWCQIFHVVKIVSSPGLSQHKNQKCVLKPQTTYSIKTVFKITAEFICLQSVIHALILSAPQLVLSDMQRCVC